MAALNTLTAFSYSPRPASTWPSPSAASALDGFSERAFSNSGSAPLKSPASLRATASSSAPAHAVGSGAASSPRRERRGDGCGERAAAVGAGRRARREDVAPSRAAVGDSGGDVATCASSRGGETWCSTALRRGRRSSRAQPHRIPGSAPARGRPPGLRRGALVAPAPGRDRLPLPRPPRPGDPTGPRPPPEPTNRAASIPPHDPLAAAPRETRLGLAVEHGPARAAQRREHARERARRRGHAPHGHRRGDRRPAPCGPAVRDGVGGPDRLRQPGGASASCSCCAPR